MFATRMIKIYEINIEIIMLYRNVNIIYSISLRLKYKFYKPLK